MSVSAGILDRLKDIPTLPIVAVQVQDLINNPASTSLQIAELLKKDQVLTAKILRLVNSSYYAVPGGVTDVKRALAFLGFNTIAQLVLGLSVFSLFKGIDEENFSMPSFWRHAFGTAIASEIIAKRINYPKPEEVFTCGLLHDLGKLVFAELDAENFKAHLLRATTQTQGFYETEIELKSVDHCVLGEAIAQRWGLPPIIRFVIKNHHAGLVDEKVFAGTPGGYVQALHIVRFANALAVKNKIGKSGDASSVKWSQSLLGPVGLMPSHIEEIEKKVFQEIENAGAMLDVYK